MHKIYLHCVGKAKEKWIDEGIALFTARMKSYADIKLLYYKSNQDLEKCTHTYHVLSPDGISYDSVQFSQFLMKSFEKEGATLHFFIGAADGLTPKLRKGALSSISLSAMTFTHEMAKLFFIEQLYRAFEIHFNRGYHK